jgi:hypothetical protein
MKSATECHATSNARHLSMRYRGLFRLWSRPCLCVGGFVVWTSMSSLFLFAPWGLARRSKRVHDPSATGDGLLWYGCLGAKSMANADFTRTGLLTMLLCFLLAHTMGADKPEKYQCYHGHNGGKATYNLQRMRHTIVRTSDVSTVSSSLLQHCYTCCKCASSLLLPKEFQVK